MPNQAEGVGNLQGVGALVDVDDLGGALLDEEDVLPWYGASDETRWARQTNRVALVFPCSNASRISTLTVVAS